MNSVAAPIPPASAAAYPALRMHTGEKAEKHFTPLVQQFLSYLKLEKHFSEYTVKSYGADLIQFGQFLSGEIGQQPQRSEEHTSELQSQSNLVCRLLLEKKKKKNK